MPRHPKKSPEEWDVQKERIRTYYVVEKKTLNETIDLMKTYYGFDASKREYVRRLALWKLPKYVKKQDWRIIHERNSAQKDTLPFHQGTYHTLAIS
ncbi:hypothetical protein G7Z17_g3024 [Cylindrodendrum hubeiense]|uniref:Clr5 domain-containing protein n=1 Tax=Cylindrodendrum hubeiense TaxID=595255 RepID=A0A9P5HBM7_9HYPO|nr:hypothetical protein G7Z17_g3024 [Cylindrodendrum hubeiense]